MRLEKLFSGMLAASFVIGAAQAQGENQPPVCTDQGDIVVECQGLTTSVTITVNVVDPEGDPLSYGWDYCPAAFLTDPTSPTTEVIFDTSMTCSLSCGMRYDIVDPFGNKCASGCYVFVVPGTDGCSPGYWKNHPADWTDTPFATNSDFDATFGVNVYTPNKSLLQVLNTGGGGRDKLGRMGVAALLNAANPDVAFPLAVGQVLQQVHDAMLSGQYEPLATTLDGSTVAIVEEAWIGMPAQGFRKTSWTRTLTSTTAPTS